MKPSELKGILKVGMKVKVKVTNSHRSIGFVGEVGEIGKFGEGAYIWNNDFGDAVSYTTPKGYSNNYYFYWDQLKVDIEILYNEFSISHKKEVEKMDAMIANTKMSKTIYEVLVVDKRTDKIVLKETVIAKDRDSVVVKISVANAATLKGMDIDNLLFNITAISSY